MSSVKPLMSGPCPGVEIDGPQAELQKELQNLQTQQATLQEQAQQSGVNLVAQHSALMAQQQERVEEAVRLAQESTLQSSAQKTQTNLIAFDAVLQPIIDGCSKESISNGKVWILQHSVTAASYQVIAQHLLKSSRRKTGSLRKAIENVVVPMFCNASLTANDAQLPKLSKLLSIWGAPNNYFDEGIIEKLKQPSTSWSDYQANIVSQFASTIAKITISTKQTYDIYQSQHQAFVAHASNQISSIEQRKRTIEQQLMPSMRNAASGDK